MATNLYTHKTGVVYSSDEGQLVGITNTYTGNEESGIKQITTASDTNKQLSIASGSTYTNIVSMMMQCTVSATLQTFSGSTGKDSFTLTAKNLQFWNDTTTGSLPLTSAFDTVKYTTSAAGVLQIRLLSQQ